MWVSGSLVSFNSQLAMCSFTSLFYWCLDVAMVVIAEISVAKFWCFHCMPSEKNDRLIIRIVYKNENETIVLFFLLCFYWLILPFAFKGTPCITDCVMAELEKLGQKYRVALRYFPMFFSYFNFIDEKSSSFAVELYVFSVSIC